MGPPACEARETRDVELDGPEDATERATTATWVPEHHRKKRVAQDDESMRAGRGELDANEATRASRCERVEG